MAEASAGLGRINDDTTVIGALAFGNGQPCLFNDAEGETRIMRLYRPGVRRLALVSDKPDQPHELRNGIDAERIQGLGRIVWSSHNWV